MKSTFQKVSVSLLALAAMCMVACQTDGMGYEGGPSGEKEYADSSEGESGGNGQQPQAGVITAGEWNDLSNWSFWENLWQKDDFRKPLDHWGFFTNNRVSVELHDNYDRLAVNAEVTLKQNGQIIAKAKSDNAGKAELWIDLFQKNEKVDYSQLILGVNGTDYQCIVKPYNEGVNNLTIEAAIVNNRIEVAFMVDATGSMDDELEYLKTEVVDVINRVKQDNPTAWVYTAAVFYRDLQDEYTTKVSPFTDNIQVTNQFIGQQRADGGGDFPEAVDIALEKSIGELQWSFNAKTRLLFLLLDAPPHFNSDVMQKIYASIAQAQEKGIKLIPVTASGIDRETEFLMRFFAVSTNGSYVFITNHSGIGNDHLEPSVGEYQVEFLNDLMVRLINQYAR
ncbi:MAG: VWA domain-containing protein [Candidatus Symbiothrix sp.]|jgi:hypothetical protein|nr:VWA domain-containing protein [Candidatus Symbiothrix sp.]